MIMHSDDQLDCPQQAEEIQPPPPGLSADEVDWMVISFAGA